VIWTGEAAATKARSLHPEIAPVLLDQNVGGEFGYAEQAVHGVADRHGFGDTLRRLRVRHIQFPTGVQLNERQLIGTIPIHFVCGHVDEHCLWSAAPRRLEQH